MSDHDATTPKPKRPSPNPRGRKPKLTPEVRGKIAEALTLGTMSMASAARYAQIDPRTLDRWLVRGRSSLALPESKRADTPEAFERWRRDQKYRLLCRAVDRARQDGKKTLETMVAQHAIKDGRLALEVLARKYPEEWARRDRNETTVSGNVDHVHSLAPDAAREMLASALGARIGGGQEVVMPALLPSSDHRGDASPRAPENGSRSATAERLSKFS